MKTHRNTSARSPGSARLITVASVLAVFAAGYAQADKPTLPIPGQLPAKVAGPAFETLRARPVPVQAAVPETGPRELIREPAGGGYVSLRDVPASSRAVRSEPPRAHIQGDDAQIRGDSRAIGQPLFRKAPASAPSSPPDTTALRAAGDPVQIFDGVSDADSYWAPPDMVLAVGPAHAVEAANSGFAVYTKFGTEVESYRTFDDFFDANLPDPWDGFMFDPRIVYDPVRERFVMLALGKDETNETSYLFLALSETSDPTGDWCTRRVTATDTGGTSTAWLDYAGLGVDSWGLYVTGNYFYFSGGKRGAAIRSFNTDIFDDCTQALTMTKFPDVQWPSGGQADSLQPAHPHSINGDEETFFVATYPGSGDKVLLGKLTGDRASSPTLTKVEIDIPAYDEISTEVDQPGSSTDLDGGRAKVQNAVYANRRIFFSLTDDVQNDGSASGWLTVKLDTDLNTEEWHHLLWGGEGIYYFYPALTLQGAGIDNNLAVFGSWTDAETTITASTYYPSGLFKIYENQPNDSTGTFVGTAVGAASYVQLDLNGRNRWGDYSGAAYDWTCGHAWGVVESAYAADSWKTTLIAREFADEGECPLMEVVDPAPNVVWSSGTTQTIRWLSDGLPETDEIYIYVWTQGAVLTVAEGLSPTLTSYNWEVPEVPAEGALLSMGSWDGSTYTAIAWSQPFDIVDGTPPSPDPLAWGGGPTARSTVAIEMFAVTATDGAGGNVEYFFDFTSSPSGGTGGSDSGWISSMTYEDAGLLANHKYCYRVRARDDLNNTTGYAPERCVFTFASEPVPAQFGRITESSIIVNWSAGGNPGYTEYLVQNQTAGTDSGWQTDTSWKSEGLGSDTPYSFRVKARNGDGVETAGVDLGSAATMPLDADGDGLAWSADNCTEVSNADQRDTDGDGVGNVCDGDLDQDCQINFVDVGIMKEQFFGTDPDPDADLNGDGEVNFLDLGIQKSAFFQAPGPSGVRNICTP